MKKQKVYGAGTQVTELYDGAVKISYDDANHSYVKALRFPDGTYTDWLPTNGITAPLDGENGLIPKPYLKAWASKLAVYASLAWAFRNPGMRDEVDQMLLDVEKGLDKDGNWAFTKKYNKWLSPLKGAFRKASDSGKDSGTWLHQAIEDFYNSDREKLPLTTPEVQPMWDCFRQMDNLYKPKTYATEFFVYSMMYGYSGQGDWKGEWTGKGDVILDWKTTNRNRSNPDGISVSYFFQLGGLAQAEFERTGYWVKDLGIVNLDKKGEAPIICWASDFGMSPMDCAKAYISFFNTFHLLQIWEYKFLKRDK